MLAVSVFVEGAWSHLPFPRWAVLAVGMAAAAAWSVLLLSLHRRSTRTTRRFRLLGEVAAEVNRAVLLNEDEDKIFSTILDYAFRILDQANHGSVLTFNEEGYLVVAASRGFAQEYTRAFRIRFEDSWQFRQTQGNLTDALIVTPRTIAETDIRPDGWSWEHRTVISTPLFIGGRLYGLLNVDSHRRRSFGKEDLELLRWFRGQIEVCLLARDLYRTALADSRMDGLTKFLSRVTFDERVQSVVEHSQRYGTVFTLGMFDVDKLKTINDRFGHVAGDRVLVAVADAIRAAARKSDVLGRYGGDEFVALFHNTDAASMADRTNRVLAGLRAAPPVHEGQALPASFSFGFADFPADGGTFQDLVAAADKRLYGRKADSQNA